MASPENTDSSSRIIDPARLETEFKKDKCRAKSNFTRSHLKLPQSQTAEETDKTKQTQIEQTYEKH